MPIGRSNSLTHKIGANAEDNAILLLVSNGYEIITQNWYKVGVGEIDIIAKKETTLAFVEVRTRKKSKYGSAIESISMKKQQKIIDTAQYFLMENEQYSTYDCRFDVVVMSNHANGVIDTETIEWVQAAFML